MTVVQIAAGADGTKELLWFDQSGHETFMDEPAKFNHAMVDMVRPLVAQ